MKTTMMHKGLPALMGALAIFASAPSARADVPAKVSPPTVVKADSGMGVSQTWVLASAVGALWVAMGVLGQKRTH